MNHDAFTPWASLAGGALIGLATGLALLLNGKIAGISGVIARILRPTPGDTLWRIWFVAGLVVGGAFTFAAYAPSGELDFSRASLLTMAGAGLLVGLGARIGGGCTSGHGVCGIARGSISGIPATVTFVVVAGLVVFLRAHVLGGAN